MTSAQAFYSKESTEAVLSFSHHVTIKSKTRPTREKAQEEIRKQLVYALGPLSVGRFPAAVKRDSTSLKRIHIQKSDVGTWVADYDYESIIQATNGPANYLSLFIPILEPDAFFNASLDPATGKTLCADENVHPFSFPYVWNPYLAGCPLKEDRDFSVLSATLRRIDNSKNAFPDYKSLPDSKGRTLVTIFFGMENHNNVPRPDITTDQAAKGYLAARKGLLDRGFVGGRMASAQLDVIVPKYKVAEPFVEVFTKKTAHGPMEVRLFFGATVGGIEAAAFYFLLKDALENASVLIYEGHSGMGEGLAFEKFAGVGTKVVFDPKKYQIFFFDACLSYSGYGLNYFYRHSPATRVKPMNVLTAGVWTDYDQDFSFALFDAVYNWAEDKGVASFADIVGKLDPGYLYGVSGEEYNPTTADEAIGAGVSKTF